MNIVKKNILNNKIFKNASWIIICKIVQSLLSLVVTMLTARYLGPSNYGVINYAAAIVAFVVPIVQLGLGNIQVQELVNNPEEEGKILGTTLCLSLISAAICSIGVIAFSYVSNINEPETIIVCALYSLILFFQGAELLQYWFQYKYLSKYASISTLIAFAIVTVYKVILLVSGASIYWFALSNCIDYMIITFALIFLYKKLNGKKLSFSIEVGKRMLDKSKYYIIANMMIVVFTQTDRVMLKQMMDAEATGLYSAASSCAQMANFVFAAIIDSYRPLIFEKHKQSKNKFELSMIQLYSIVIYLSILECLFITIFGGAFIKIIYGSQYLNASSCLRISVWFTLFSFIGSVRNVWVLAEGRQKWIWKINLSGAMANVILNYFLIPKFGINGAAVASLITQIFANVVVSYLIKATRENTYLMLKGFDPRNIIRVFKVKDEN